MNEGLKILKKHWKESVSMVMILIAASMIGVACNYSSKWILDVILMDIPVKQQIVLACQVVFFVLALWAFNLALQYIRTVFRNRMRWLIKNDLRTMAAKKIESIDYHTFHQKDSGSYVSWFSNDAEQLYSRFFDKLWDCISYLFTAVFALGVLFSFHWGIALVTVVMFLITFMTPQLFKKKLEQANLRRSAAMEQSIEGFKDTVMGVPILYLNNLAERITSRIYHSSNQSEKEIFAADRSEAQAQVCVQAINIFGQVGTNIIAIIYIVYGVIPVSAFAACGSMAGNFFNATVNFVNAWMTIRSSASLWQKFQAEEKETEAKEEVKELSNIDLHDLSYSYGSKQVLQPQNLRFQKGGKYAIIGESGSGKSTLLKIILGMLPGYQGQVLYDGLEQKQVDLSSLYEQVAYADQQVYLFQDSLRFNITLGQDCNDEMLYSVLKRCRLDDFVASLPEGVDSYIGENGKNLSGGQRQRIALARCLLRNTDYLIMDEGTSALDLETAVAIEENLIADPKLTVIFITHNLRESIRRELTAVYELNP